MAQYHLSDFITSGTSQTTDCHDMLGRCLKDLRISVTDRCNFRCIYCMPKQVFGKDFKFIEHSDMLRFEEIVRISHIFAEMGGEKIRLTGGEPLLRRNIDVLIKELSHIQTHDNRTIDLTLTTNGSLLKQQAKILFNAGLKRITVSLDAIDDEIFKKMSDSAYHIQNVLDGINAAIDAGFSPIKINVVIKKGFNTEQILPLIHYFMDKPVILRFIEYMDVGTTNETALRDVVPAKSILQCITSEYEIHPLPANYPGETAKRWQFVETGHEFGIISSMSEPFCEDCTRLRLSTDGKCYNCLFATEGFDLRALIRSQASDLQIKNALLALWKNRANQYSALRQKQPSGEKKIQMFYIGG